MGRNRFQLLSIISSFYRGSLHCCVTIFVTGFRIGGSDGAFWLVKVILNLLWLDSRLRVYFRAWLLSNDFYFRLSLLYSSFSSRLSLLYSNACSICFRQNLPVTSWFKVDGRIIANLIRLLFWRGCSLLDDRHSCAGVLGGNQHLSWFAQFRKELSTAEKV